MKTERLPALTKSFTMKIDPDLQAKAAQKAAESGLTLSQVMRFLLKEWVESKQQKMFF